ncbi:MAG: tetratricopeptide repeat protein [Myxococcota bacterium]
MKIRSVILGLGLALLAGSAFGQEPAAPPEADVGRKLKSLDEVESSTASLDLDEEARPQRGPGSLISERESRPLTPPSAAEVSAVEGFEAELQARQRELEYFQSGADEYARDLKQRIALAYEEQKRILSLQYDNAIAELEEEERRRRIDAIARFEAFIEKYPGDPIYTPDAMFRLAELYFEKSADDFLIANRAYEDELIAFDEGRRATEPEPPTPSYEKTIALHSALLGQFPDYRLADAARYLLGYSYGEQQQYEEALEAYQSLVANYPTSKFLPEVWTRIGEIYFDRSGTENLENAIAAYSEVTRYPDSPFYDKALYKIAWTYYRLDRFQESVDSFIGLVAYADQQEALTGVSGSELRAEALEYVAISLADESWGGFSKAKQVLTPLQEKEYAAELWQSYGEILFDQTRYADAIGVLRYTIAEFPNQSDNPEAQEKIVRAYERLRNFDGATEAREQLVADYSKGSSWYQANAGNEDALRKAESLTERSLYTAAIFRHQQAQAFKGDGRIRQATTSYGQAADAYQSYLERFPKSSNAYDFEFYLAECLFYSGDYGDAANQYGDVRDSTINNKHLEAAALSAVIAYEKLIETESKGGGLQSLPLLTADQRKGQEVAPKEIAPVRRELVSASDRYLTLIPEGERAPAIAYRAAEVYYRHDQFPEARRRFESIVETYPQSEVAKYASNLIIESYLAVEDWEAVEEVSNRLMAAAGSSEETTQRDEFVAQLQVFKVGAQFKQAEKFDAQGDFEKAASTYVRLVDENPSHEFADKALFNAAIAFEKVKRFDSASQVYRRIYDNYPKSDLAPRALFREGINAEKGFDFDSAVGAYGKLIARYPDSENLADAMYNLAVVLENTQDYGRAADAYADYAQAFARRDDSGEVFFRSALVYEKMEAYPQMIATLESFISRYRRDRKQQERIVQAYQKMGEAYAAQGNERQAQGAYRDCVRTFRQRRLSVRSSAGARAADCQLQLAEAKFKQYDELKIEGTGRAQVKALQAKARAQREVEQAFKQVFDYKRVEPTLAASYRIGHSYERFAEALFTAPIPPEFQEDEELAFEYKAQLEDRASVLERKAEAAYRKAYEEGKRTKVTNKWTERTLEGLNKYNPGEFPIQKRGKRAIQPVGLTGNGLVGPRPAPADPSRETEASSEPAPDGAPGDDAPGLAPPGEST